MGKKSPPKVASRTAARPKKRFYKSKHVWAAVGLIVFGYLLFRQVEMRIQKAEFRRAEAYVSSEQEKIRSTAGVIGSDSTERYCYYMARKYEHGPRECIITSKIIFNNLSIDDANRLVRKFADITGGKVSSSFTDGDSGQIGSSQNVYQTERHHVLDHCSRVYRYHLMNTNEFQARDFIAELSCKGGALAEYYPVRE